MPALPMARILEEGGPEVDRYLGEDIYANTRPDYLAKQRKRFGGDRAPTRRGACGDKPTLSTARAGQAERVS